jgi:hypothetical protein
MLVVLHSHHEADLGRVFRLGHGYRTLVGRADTCDCVLQESSVSRVHFSIEYDAGQFYVFDRCSTYGTYLNHDGRQIERVQLRSGDRIRAGGVVLKYFRGDDIEAKALQTLSQLAFLDPLTGGLKIEGFLQKLRRKLASEPVDSLYVFSVEIRDLASINQAHGMIAGDMVLSELAQRLRDAAGDQGQVARIGGCRFLAFKQLSQKLRSSDPLPAIEQELRVLPMTVNGQSLYPELVVKVVNALECVTTPPQELAHRLLEDPLQSAFISYGTPDLSFAKRLAAALKASGIRTFLFEEDAVPGAALHDVMFEGVNGFDRMILVCSRSSLQRAGVGMEIEEVLRREARLGSPSILIPVTLDRFVYDEWVPTRLHMRRAILDRVLVQFEASMSEADFAASVRKLVGALRGARVASGVICLSELEPGQGARESG